MADDFDVEAMLEAPYRNKEMPVVAIVCTEFCHPSPGPYEYRALVIAARTTHHEETSLSYSG